jgi:hypothetical protein
MYVILVPPVRAICPIHIIVPYFIIIFWEQQCMGYKPSIYGSAINDIMGLNTTLGVNV